MGLQLKRIRNIFVSMVFAVSLLSNEVIVLATEQSPIIEEKEESIQENDEITISHPDQSYIFGIYFSK